MSRISKVALTSFLLALAAISFQSLSAQEDPGPESKLSDKFKIHGFLNQGFAISDGTQYLGIPDDGTAAYRTAALQLRYVPSEKDEFVLQFSNEHFGESGGNELRDDAEVDWLFYQHQFTDATAIRVGRAPLPIGIYNTIKDVGTVLPLFRASPNVYGDGTWTNDTVDGVVFSHSFARESPWSLDLDVYYGEWERIEFDSFSQDFAMAEFNDAVGVQLWLNTPLPGLRFGVAANEVDVTGGLFQPAGMTLQQKNFYFSIDADFGRVMFRSEFYDNDYFGGYWRAYYGELVVKVNERLRIVTNYDHGEIKFTVPFFAVFEGDWSDDYAVAVNYRLRPNLVFKLEHHWYEGFETEGQSVDAFFDDPKKFNYDILSIAFHF